MNYGEARSFARSRSAKPGLLGRLVLMMALTLPALPAVAAETVLMLGVVRDGKFDAKATHAVNERLARAGETLAPASRLTAVERQCLQADCLESLAGREKAQIVLMARVQQSAGFAYIAASLYDAEYKRPLDVSAVCDKCLPEAMALRVGDLYTRLLRDRRDRLRAEALGGPRRPAIAALTPAAKAEAAPSASSKVPASQPAPAPTGKAGEAAAARAEGRGEGAARPSGTLVASQGESWPAATPAAAPAVTPAAALEVEESPLSTVSKRSPAAASSAPITSRRERGLVLSPRRKLIAGILGGLGAATLVTAIALHATDGQMTSMDCATGTAAAKVCVLDNKVAYTLGYAATSAFAVSIGMTLLWPERTKSTQPR